MASSLKVLSISDVVADLVYSPNITKRFAEIDLVLACGDLPYHYLEYIISSLCAPVYYVHGNHDLNRYTLDHEIPHHPIGGIDLHRKVLKFKNIILAGVEGCIRYSPGPFQYSQYEMWVNVLNLLPRLIHNQQKYGRGLDIFVTHAPAWGIHDQPDWAHQGVRAFRWLLQVFHPAYHFHGHVHLYGASMVRESIFYQTHVINTYSYQNTILDQICYE